ncbi:helix-turn-helix transcriptional regulator [Massilia pinisoli]|uniref:Helix-turn-helix transcriptional regulator n=1 Tax=Massilia pinisoli TaxID=1772194 RepID=A0ABT1ZP77_9BURK|nr:helix-turn-helix transcriptional regulator [Massilia pinisoli]MCS0581721.1 helix-turn-helix transcriptional regulator [Massilia pinisoli]
MQDGHVEAAEARSEGYFSDFGSALRYWRTRRGYSQLRLAVDSSVSQRHLSFLESGRAQPSRDLVLKLGIALDVPLRQRNAMLLAAGFAPAYQERNLSDPELSSVMQALDFMLRQQAPFPALVVDRLWNLVRFNEPAAGFMKWLLGMPADAVIPRDGSINVLRLMLDPAGLRPRLVNWQAVCADSLLWIQREAMADGPGSEATALLAELSALPGIAGGLAPDHHVPNLERRALPFLPLTLAHEGVELNLFTTITTLGTPHDVTVHELRLESFFPADGATADWFRARFGATI